MAERGLAAPSPILEALAATKAASRGPIFERSIGRDGGLRVEAVSYRDRPGAVLYYDNPPVHQIHSEALDAFKDAMATVQAIAGKLKFLLFTFPADPVHAGGDLKETLAKLDAARAHHDAILARCLPFEDAKAAIDPLYDWADARLQKAFDVYRQTRALSRQMRLIAVCAGGVRYGGSVEVPLWADEVVGDSRSVLCFSEAAIGLIPGWGGTGRLLAKTTILNARYMTAAAPLVTADDLGRAGVYDAVVAVRHPLPRKTQGQDPAAWRETLRRHTTDTLTLLLPKALDLACRSTPRPAGKPVELTAKTALAAEVARRSNPMTYAGLWGRPLDEVQAEIAQLGRPLNPASINALDRLFEEADPQGLHEEEFIRREMELDAELYRDPGLRPGIIAALTHAVADFR